MDCNKDEAAKAKELAEKKFLQKDIMGARKLALKAHNLFPSLDGLQPLLATLNVYISAERKINGDVDWYGVLGIDPSSDDETVKRQYRKLALALHPDKNKSVGSEGAFKILSEAWSLLADKARREAYDKKRNVRSIYQKVVPGNPSKPVGNNGLRPSANIGNFNERSMNRPNPHSVPVAPPRHNTFWTVCPSCKMQFEYVLMYLNKTLECYSCKDPFLAVQFPPPHPNSLPQRSSHNGPTGCDVANGSQLPHDDAQVSATLEAVMKSRTNALKRTHAGETNGSGSTGKGEKHKRRRRTHEQKMKDIEADRLARVNVAAGIGGLNGIHRSVAETEKVSIGSRWPASTRELSVVETRNMLMSKAKTEICKKLDEWKYGTSMPKASNKAAVMENGRKKDNGSMFKNLPSTVENGVEHMEIKPDDKSSSPAISVDSETQASDTAELSMTVPDPDFHDFDKDRTENSFSDTQVWAAYDNDDGMPRYYAMIHNVISRKPFKMRISWLNSKSTAEFGSMNWVGCGFYKTSGDFRVGKHEINKSVNSFSHRVKWAKGARGAIRIYPSKGDVWALYRNWSPEWNEHTPDETIHQYDMVEVLSGYNEEKGVTVIPLVKVAGFKTVFRQHTDQEQARLIPREEMLRFSHQVPSCWLTGQESPNAPKHCWELDPAATPLELLQVITESPGKSTKKNASDLKQVNLKEPRRSDSAANELKGIKNGTVMHTDRVH